MEKNVSRKMRLEFETHEWNEYLYIFFTLKEQ